MLFEQPPTALRTAADADIALAPSQPLLTSAVHAQTLPPVLLTSDPADGASWAGQPVKLTFDQPLPEDVAGSFGIERRSPAASPSTARS